MIGTSAFNHSQLRLRTVAASAVLACALAYAPGAAAALPAGCAAAGDGSVSCSFAYTGAEQQFVVPAGVSNLQVAAVGGAGASTTAPNGSVSGGLGALAQGVLPVSPGQVLYVEVGGSGNGTNGGFNGGGAGASTGGGGGGASDLRICSMAALSCDGGNDTLATRLLVAGGGGGAGGAGEGQPGGAGGNAGAVASSGADGATGLDTNGGGGGQRAGAEVSGNGGAGGPAAAPGCNADGSVCMLTAAGVQGLDGTAGFGGAGRTDVAGFAPNAQRSTGSGGGGGGWFGGGGGGSGSDAAIIRSSPTPGGQTRSTTVNGTGGGGGAGSSYVEPVASQASLGVAASGLAPSVTITYTPPSAAGFGSVTQPNIQTGQPVSYRVPTTGTPAPRVTLLKGELPPGLSLTPDGTISGTPTTIGAYDVTLQADNGVGSPAQIDLKLDPGVAVKISTASVQAPASAQTTCRIPVDLLGTVSVPVSWRWQTSDDTAIAGVDYAAASGTLTIPAGETHGEIPVDVLANPRRDSSTTVTVTLFDATGPYAYTICTIDPAPAGTGTGGGTPGGGTPGGGTPGNAPSGNGSSGNAPSGHGTSGGGTTHPGPSASHGTLRLLGRPTFDGSAISIVVSCAGGSACDTNVTAVAVSRGHRVLVAALRRQLRTHGSQRLRVELNRVGRALLAASHRLPITIAMTTGGGTQPPVTVRIVL